MRAICVANPGGREGMVVSELETPRPSAGQVLVRVQAAGINFIDVYQRSGQYKMPLPGRLGLEGAGYVEEVGPDVTRFRPGDRVAWSTVPGSYASHVVAPVEKLVHVPSGISAKMAAAAMLQGMTAQYLVTSTYRLSPGDACVVHAAAGGVGLLLCQLADHLGAFVFGTVSTEAKAKLAREAGADEVFVHDKVDFAVETKRLTNGLGANVVYDSIGKDTFDRSLSALARRGMLVLYGQASGAVPPFDPQRLAAAGSVFFTRPSLFDYTATHDELSMRASYVFARVLEGSLKVAIHSELPLSDAPEAHRRLEARETTGKVLLIPE